MTTENGNKPEAPIITRPFHGKDKLLVFLLRLAALLASITATLLMGLNKQTRTVTVAVVGTKPIFQTFTAKFQQTPAFVYFVVVNIVASFYNLMMMLMLLISYLKGRRNDLLVHLLDMLMFAVVVTAAAGAAAIAELGKNGNLHTRWNPICSKFDEFCLHGGLAITACFIGAIMLLINNVVSAIIQYRNATN